jgi:protein O-mannosyl-transferase
MAAAEAIGFRRLAAAARAAALPAGLALAVLAAFAPALRNGFVWDDQFNLLDNPHVRGLGRPEVWWMLTTAGSTHPGWGGQWIPVTWLTFAIDYRVWGLDPVGFHLTNLVIHAANAALFFVVARRLLAAGLGPVGGSALRLAAATAAAFWALHPLRVESVAWVTERRDVVSGFFLLLAVLAYLRAAEVGQARRRRWLAASVGSYALALASKATGVTLPLALLILDAYPLARLRGRWRERLVEKLPYVLLATADAVLTLHAVRLAASLTSLARYPLPARIAVALYGLCFYVEKTIFPVGLSPLYELPVSVNPLGRSFAARALAALTLTTGLWLLRRRWPAGLAAWAGFALLLAPVSGLVHVGYHLVADRYSYLPGFALALLVGAGAGLVAAGAGRPALRPAYARVMLVVIAGWVLGLGSLTARQALAWADAETLWQSALGVDPACGICHGNLGAALEREGFWVPAIAELEQALTLRPDQVGFQRNLGLALLASGRPGEAVAHFRIAAQAIPTDPDLRTYFGLALLGAGQSEAALAQFSLAVRLDPSNAEARANRAALLRGQGPGRP